MHSGPYTNLPSPSHYLSSLQFFIPIVIIFIPPYPYFVLIMQIPHHPSDSPSSYLYHFPYAWKSFTWSPSSHYFSSFRTSYPYHYIPSYFQSHHNCQAHHFPISHAHLAHHHTHISIATYPYQPILHLLTLITPVPTYLSLYYITPIPCMHQFSHVLDRTSSDLFNEHEENGKPAVLIRSWMMLES